MFSILYVQTGCVPLNPPLKGTSPHDDAMSHHACWCYVGNVQTHHNKLGGFKKHNIHIGNVQENWGTHCILVLGHMLLVDDVPERWKLITRTWLEYNVQAVLRKTTGGKIRIANVKENSTSSVPVLPPRLKLLELYL